MASVTVNNLPTDVEAIRQALFLAIFQTNAVDVAVKQIRRGIVALAPTSRAEIDPATSVHQL